MLLAYTGKSGPASRRSSLAELTTRSKIIGILRWNEGQPPMHAHEWDTCSQNVHALNGVQRVCLVKRMTFWWWLRSTTISLSVCGSYLRCCSHSYKSQETTLTCFVCAFISLCACWICSEVWSMCADTFPLLKTTIQSQTRWAGTWFSFWKSHVLRSVYNPHIPDKLSWNRILIPKLLFLKKCWQPSHSAWMQSLTRRVTRMMRPEW